MRVLFFYGFVNVNTNLVEFVNQYDKVIVAHHRAESQEDFLCLNCVSNCTSNSYEIQVAKYYTRKIFKIFKKQWAIVIDTFF